jgi:hypothetical protein
MRTVLRTIDDLQRFVSTDLAGLDFDGKKAWEVTLRVWRKPRTINQNRLYWMWLTLLSDETGNDRDDLHDYFRRKYLPWSQKDVMGETMFLVSSTTKLDTKQFTDYLENIRREGSQLGVYLPSPGDPAWPAFEEQVGPKTVIEEG